MNVVEFHNVLSVTGVCFATATGTAGIGAALRGVAHHQRYLAGKSLNQPLRFIAEKIHETPGQILDFTCVTFVNSFGIRGLW